MTLIVGGASQGKLHYVLCKTGHTDADVAHTPEQARTKPIFSGVAQWVRQHPDTDLELLLQENPEIILICDEVGCGVVPLLPEERAWREAVGRLCCTLAGQARCVQRVFCGLPVTLKGEAPWN